MLINRKAIDALADLRVWLDSTEDVHELIVGVIELEGIERDELIAMFEDAEESNKIRAAAFTFANNVLEFDGMTLMTVINTISRNFNA